MYIEEEWEGECGENLKMKRVNINNEGECVGVCVCVYVRVSVRNECDSERDGVRRKKKVELRNENDKTLNKERQK